MGTEGLGRRYAERVSITDKLLLEIDPAIIQAIVQLMIESTVRYSRNRTVGLQFD